ncbi:hemin receptor [Phototrophicus methaneseepsis]|uniref:Hemin receptor n=1 Tax=Phototrophicus methaneseepsis TaxID=2710758 RepID=A0A7S8IGN0_9CHLR|nr:globin domain-containing protein [Phototrophicus methaneseepsis]QPC84223.1 hemin receptor [Phototrophicus methaneseepsis]
MQSLPITQEQIQIVRTSFEKVAASRLPTGKLFYDRLFELAPQTKALFVNTEIEAQGDKLVRMIGVAVGALSQPDALIPVLVGLGERHLNYGVTDEMYNPGGEALIWTLRYVLGAEFTKEVQEAWLSVYSLMVQVILDAAHQAQ